MPCKKRKKKTPDQINLVSDDSAIVCTTPTSYSIVDIYMRVNEAQSAQATYLKWNAWRVQNIQIYQYTLVDLPRLAEAAEFARGLRNSYPDSENYDMASFRATHEWGDAKNTVNHIRQYMVFSEEWIKKCEPIYAEVLAEFLTDILGLLIPLDLRGLILDYSLEYFVPFTA
jgi:hypothetical protein